MRVQVAAWLMRLRTRHSLYMCAQKWAFMKF
jgi:hypothetical protein